MHTTTNLSADDLVDIGPIPCTSVARTILGLAALVPPLEADLVRDVVDRAVRDGMASDRWLWWRLTELRCRGRNGVSVLEATLGDRAGMGRTESWLERETLRLIAAAGLPLPTVRRRIRRRGAFVARVDFAYEGERIVIEVDGHGSHSTRAERAADAARRNQLGLLDFRVLVFTYDQVVCDPATVVADIVDALARRAA